MCSRRLFRRKGGKEVGQKYHAFSVLPSAREQTACIRPPLASGPQSKPANPARKPPNGNPSDSTDGGEFLLRICVMRVSWAYQLIRTGAIQPRKNTENAQKEELECFCASGWWVDGPLFRAVFLCDLCDRSRPLNCRFQA